MDYSIFLIFLVIIVFGSLGGIIGHFYNFDELSQGPGQKFPHWARSVIAGVAAAFLVPLFLTMASSKLVEKIISGDVINVSNLFVFIGFCIAASVSSRRFIGSISKQLHDKIQNFEETAERADRAVKEVEDVLNEDEVGDVETVPQVANIELTEENTKLIESFRANPLMRRSISGLSRDTGIPYNSTKEQLDELMSKKVVEKVQTQTDGSDRYVLSIQGKSLKL